MTGVDWEAFVFRTLILATLVAPLALAPAKAEDCPTMLHLHGYLTVAIAKCGFREASAVINAASACRAQVGHASATQTATEGIRFALGEMKEKGGIGAWCVFAKAQYPSLLSGSGRRH